jgi:AraC-like DNA-binding protein
MAPPRRPPALVRGPVKPVAYAPPAGYGHDVEVIRVAELRRRARRHDALGIERVDFHCLVHVTAGRYRQMVDFETFECGPGSVLTLQPGQVHRFGTLSGWTGWLLVYRAEAVRSRAASASPRELEAFHQLAGMPTLLTTAGATRRAVGRAFGQIEEDSRLKAPAPVVNALLKAQLEALLTRLQLARPDAAVARALDPALSQWYRRYRSAVERDYRRWHGVGRYAADLGCSEKTLNRATRAVADRSAKSLLVDRIVLEAKRLLAHSSTAVAVIAAELGFDEATNFVKFFRRETGVTPGGFRARQKAGRRPAEEAGHPTPVSQR